MTVVSSAEVRGTTPLLIATEMGLDEFVVLLMQNGVDPNISAGDGATVLTEAIENGRVGVVNILVGSGVDVNKIGSCLSGQACSYGTPLTYAAGSGNLEIVSMLIESGAIP